MKKFLFALGTLAMFAFTACDDSASSGEDSNSGNGSGSNGTSEAKGSFPPNGGDAGYYCDVTSGEGWAQIKVNIPGYKGHVEKRSYDAATNTATQYYEESQYNLSPLDKVEMCLEYDRDIRDNTKKNRYLTDYYCKNSVFYMVGTISNASYLKEDYAAAKYEFMQSCEDYDRKWEEHGYDEVINRRRSNL
jgi:hypothetical protein